MSPTAIRAHSPAIRVEVFTDKTQNFSQSVPPKSFMEVTTQAVEDEKVIYINWIKTYSLLIIYASVVRIGWRSRTRIIDNNGYNPSIFGITLKIGY